MEPENRSSNLRIWGAMAAVFAAMMVRREISRTLRDLSLEPRNESSNLRIWGAMAAVFAAMMIRRKA